MSATDLTLANPSRRKILFAAVSSTCHEVGFTTAERSALETLTEMMQSFMFELSRNSRSYCEVSGRTEVLATDVCMALIDMGFNVESLPAFAKRPNRITLPTPMTIPKTSTPRLLQAGEKKSLPNYIPDYFPAFPDPHTYIRTATHRQPITEYETIREKSSSQKRDTERSLTRFIASTQKSGRDIIDRFSATQALFPEDPTLFPLIACKSTANPFISALIFSDQVFDEEQPETTNQPPSPLFPNEDLEQPKDANTDGDIMDNPYLRPAKLQKKKRK